MSNCPFNVCACMPRRRRSSKHCVRTVCQLETESQREGVCDTERETCTESFPGSVMAAILSLSLSLSLPPSSTSSSSSSSSSRLRLCGSSVPRHAVLNMHGSVSPPVASYLLHHSSRYFKESATFALGLNYVQFAKLGLKPLGGGKALWPIYQCSFFLPLTETEPKRYRERDFTQFSRNHSAAAAQDVWKNR